MSYFPIRHSLLWRIGKSVTVCLSRKSCEWNGNAFKFTLEKECHGRELNPDPQIRKKACYHFATASACTCEGKKELYISWLLLQAISTIHLSIKCVHDFASRQHALWQKKRPWKILRLISSESSNVYTGTPYSGWGQYEPLVSTQTPCISLTRGSLSWLVATREADTRGLSWYSGFVFCPHPSWGPGIDTTQQGSLK